MIYSFLYVLVMSIAIVLIQKLDMSIPPLLSLLVTASIASLYFNIINRGHLKKIYFSCLENKKQWLLVMFIVLIMWATSMIGPGELGASLFNFIYFAWLGMLGFIFLSFQRWQEQQINFYFGSCLFLLIILSIFFELHSSFTYEAICGIFLALPDCVSGFETKFDIR